jgi:hypothetical protein
MATTVRIPTLQGDNPPYDEQVELDGVLYTFGFRYLTRSDQWLFDMRTAAGVDVLIGQAVINGYPLLARFPDLLLPQGVLMAVAATDPDRPANENELGTRVQVTYESVA